MRQLALYMLSATSRLNTALIRSHLKSMALTRLIDILYAAQLVRLAQSHKQLKSLLGL